VDHIFYRQKIGQGFIQRHPSELAPAKPTYFNIDSQVTGSLIEVKTSAIRSEHTATVVNAFYASIAHEAQMEAFEALETSDIKNAKCLLEQVSNNLGETRDMLNDRMLFLHINADPGAAWKQKSFANGILRNEFTPRVADRGGYAKIHMYYQLDEEQCLKATLSASTKAQANRHLATGSYRDEGGGAGNNTNSSSANINGKKSGTKKGLQPQ
jgi:hypothetical protein